MKNKPYLSKHIRDYVKINQALINRILERFSTDYPWIDMKYDIISKKDYNLDDETRGQNSIYSWIQGRGLESMALHADWFEATGYHSVKCSIDETLQIVRKSLEAAVLKSGSYLAFTLDTRGNSLSAETPKNALMKSFGDIFASRGLFSAARRLKADSSWEEKYCNDSITAVFEGRIFNDQYSFDHMNKAQDRSGRSSYTGYMLGIGTMNLLWRKTGNREYINTGLNCIEFILNNHVNINSKWNTIPEWSITEYIDESGLPYRSEGGIVLSDPGHALEFVGLTTVFLEGLPENNDRMETIRKYMFSIFAESFRNGYKSIPGGIVKTIDLVTGGNYNSTFPWWSLPETMRSAIMLAAGSESEKEQDYCLHVYQLCRNDYLQHYVNTAGSLEGIQVLDSEGTVSDIISAVPDVDPGYHTGLCFIDVISCIEKDF